MSVTQMAMVWQLDLSPNHKVVLLAYADHADDEGYNVYPSLGKIAWKTGYSRDQVRRITQHLVSKNLMQLEQKGVGRGNSDRYFLSLEKGSKLPPFRRREKVADLDVKGGVATPPEPPQRTAIVSTTSSLHSEVVDGQLSLPSMPKKEKVEKKYHPKREGFGRLCSIVSEYRANGFTVLSMSDRDISGLNSRYHATRKDGFTEQEREWALRYMVARTAGQIEGLKPVWCVYDTALHAVRAGWRPPQAQGPNNEEARRGYEENLELLERAMKEAM